MLSSRLSYCVNVKSMGATQWFQVKRLRYSDYPILSTRWQHHTSYPTVSSRGRRCSPQVQLLNMSQSSFSMGVLPIVLLKKMFSMLSGVTRRRRGITRSRRPNLKQTPSCFTFTPHRGCVLGSIRACTKCDFPR